MCGTRIGLNGSYFNLKHPSGFYVCDMYGRVCFTEGRLNVKLHLFEHLKEEEPV